MGIFPAGQMLQSIKFYHDLGKLLHEPEQQT